MRYIAVGDIHGCFVELKILMDHLIENIYKEGDIFVFLGDYIDRGFQSKQVIDYLLELKEKYECVFLKGNHEDMLNDNLGFGGNYGEYFLINGGWHTLASYTNATLPESYSKFKKMSNEEVHKLQNDYHAQIPVIQGYGFSGPKPNYKSFIPKEHQDFLRDLHLVFQTPLCLFVHSTVDSDFSLENQDPKTVLWERDNNFNCLGWPTVVIHGHTPICLDRIKEIKEFNEINIDTGCVFGDYLTAIVCDESQKPEDWKLIHISAKTKEIIESK